MTPAIEKKIAGRALISDDLYRRLTERMADEHSEIGQDLAQRIMDQALAFLGTYATTTQPLRPSALVDIGWHTFILYTRPYAEFCDRVAGRFIHHEPDDSPQTPEGSGSLRPTMEAIRAAHYEIDPELWRDDAVCHGEGDCRAVAACRTAASRS